MESLWLLAKINVFFQIIEKVAYGSLGLYSVFIAKRYVDDYKESLEEEIIKGE